MAKKNRLRNSLEGLKLGYPFWIGITAWVVAIIAVVLAGRMIYASNAFAIKEVRAKNIVLSPETVRSIKGQSLFSFNTRELYKKIVVANTDLKDVIVAKRFPCVLEVVVIKRKPFVQVKYNGFFTVDRDAVVIDSDPAPEPNLLAVEISDSPKNPVKGSSLMTPQFKSAIAIINELKAHNIFARYPVELINVASEKSSYFVIRNKNITFSPVQVIVGNEDLSRRLFIFENLMSTKIKGDLQLVKYIDLRYKKAYVGYKN
jgi:cell division septal protein FtsQ